jgi:hypothetical protein
MIVRTIEALFTLTTKATQFNEATSLLDKVGEKAKDVAKTVAGLFALNNIRLFVSDTAQSLAEIGKTAEFLTITTDALQELRYAAQKASVPIDTLEDSFKELMLRSAEAIKTGSGEGAEAFMFLGFKPEEIKKRLKDPLELLSEMADRLKALPTQSERIFIADSLFGDQGALMMRMLKDGSGGLNDMRREARELGFVFGGEALRNSKRFNESLGKLSLSSKIAGQSLVGDMFASLAWLSEKLANATVSINKAEGSMGLFKVAVVSLSTVLAALAVKLAVVAAPFLVLAAPIILKLALIGSAVMAVGALVADLWTAFDGGVSVFGDLWHGAKYACEQIGQKFVNLCKLAKDAFANLIPDFMKKGLVSTFKVNGSLASDNYHSKANKDYTPSNTAIANRHNLVSNQSLNVSVNVKSNANPQVIGGEVSKAVRRELEKERQNAFMGVMQYAG